MQSTPATLLDRIAIALFSGLSVLVPGSLIWFLIASRSTATIPFAPVVLASVAMGVLGFLLLENFIANAIGWLFRILLLLGAWW